MMMLMQRKQNQKDNASAMVLVDLAKQNKELMLINELENATYLVPLQVFTQYEES